MSRFHFVARKIRTDRQIKNTDDFMMPLRQASSRTIYQTAGICAVVLIGNNSSIFLRCWRSVATVNERLVPEQHLARFIVESVVQLDLKAIETDPARL